MCARERNPRLDLQWPTHCAYQREKIEKSLTGFITSRGSQQKHQRKSQRNLQADFSTHRSASLGGQGCFHLYMLR